MVQAAGSKGFLIGAAVGSGGTALAAERGGADLLLAINAGRLRSMGAPSIACMLPVFDAGPLTEDFARRELLPRCSVPVLLGINAWESDCDPAAIAGRVAVAGFAGAVNFPSAMLHSRAMQQLLSRAGRGIEREVEMLRAVQDRGLTSMFYCATRTQARLAADAGLDMVCLNLGWNVGGAMGHRVRASLEEAASAVREIGRLIRRIHPKVRFLLEGGPIVTAEDLGRIAALAPIDGYVGGSTIERLPTELAIAEQIDAYREAGRRRGTLDAAGQRLAAWGQRFGFVGRAPALLAYLRRLQTLAGADTPLLIQLEPGSSAGPSLAALGAAGGRRGERTVLEIDPTADDHPARARRSLFGQADGPGPGSGPGSGGASGGAALADPNLDLLVIRAPEALPVALQRRLARALGEGAFRAQGSRRAQPVAPRVVLVTTLRQSGGAAPDPTAAGLDPALSELLTGWTLRVPPLRERIEDLPALIDALAGESGLPRRADFAAAAMKRLAGHAWPGNETELRSLLGALAGRREGARSGGPIGPQEIAPLLQAEPAPETGARGEKDRVVEALWRNGFHRGRTAEALGMSRKTLYNKMQRFGLTG